MSEPYIGLNPEDFRFLIAVHGEEVDWYKAMPCTCYNPANNDYEADGSRACPYGCEFGHQYLLQTIPAGVKAFVAGVRREYIDPQLGLIQIGDANVITMPDEIPLAPPDKLVLKQRELMNRELLVKGGTESPVNRPVVRVTTVMAGAGTIYNEGVDWQLTDDAIEWLDGGNSPDEGVNYSIEYVFRPTFWFLGIRNQAPRPSFVSDALLPMRGVLTLKHPAATAGSE